MIVGKTPLKCGHSISLVLLRSFKTAALGNVAKINFALNCQDFPDIFNGSKDREWTKTSHKLQYSTNHACLVSAIPINIRNSDITNG